MDFDYEGAEDFGGRILYGRIAVFGAALLLALILGRCTAGGGDVSQTEFDEVVASHSEARDLLQEREGTIAELQQALVDARNPDPNTGGTNGTNGPTDGGTETPADPGQVNEDGERTYEVQPGDTLSTIAEQVYNDPLAFGIIANANGLSGDQPLQVGQTLIIPANPDQ
ncbi:MAG TPA: LysM domain-containing protein [Euzebya sp.]|nr:LysM domain-containing protein [Euzebya sp.]